MSKSIIDECFIQNNLKLNYYTKLSLKTSIKTNKSHIFRDKINKIAKTTKFI